MKTSFLVLIMTLFSLNMNSQDTLILLNGKIKLGTYESMDDLKVYFRQNGKIKKISQYKVFAVSHNKERLYAYKQDEQEEDDFTIDQMTEYVRGAQDARIYFKHRLSILSGFAVGLGGGLFGLSVDKGVWPPLASAAVFGLTKSKPSRLNVPDEMDLNNKFYVAGYQHIAMRKKFIQGYISGLSGYFLGLGYKILTVTNE